MPVITDQIWTIRNLEITRHFIENSQTIAICGHKNPDGDSLGSMLSLGLGLESIGKQVYMICDDPIPRNYRSSAGADRILKNLHRNVDLAIAVDCGSKDMIGSNYEIFERAHTVIEIDHHRSRIPFGDVTIVDAEASSAAELVYELLVELDIPITIQIAQNIFTSFIVETNSFRLPGMRSRTFEICAELLKTGIDFNQLSESVYWNTSKETALLSGICMNKCKFSETGELAWASLTLADFKKVGATDADADPVTEKIRSIQGVKIAILFREKEDGKWRVSLRSKNGINLASLAEKFGGGGHTSAAGCTIAKKQPFMRKMLHSAEELLQRYNSTNKCCPAQLSQIENQKYSQSITDHIPEVVFCQSISTQKFEKKHWTDKNERISLFPNSLRRKCAS